MAYDKEFRDKVLEEIKSGKRRSEVCKNYGMSSSALDSWIKQKRNSSNSSELPEIKREYPLDNMKRRFEFAIS